ncbi:importin 13, putative, partial [Acanthamoeba castellanii str. Neff]
QKVLGLRSSYQKAAEVVDLIARVMAEEDEETAKGICQVLIRLGESFTHQLFAHDEIGRPFVEFALACMSHESREVSMVTLNFWFDLEEYLVSSPDGKPKREAYTPVFRHLLPLLVQASRFPEDFDDLPKDLRDEFIEFRNEVKDTLLYKELAAMQTPGLGEAELKATHRNIEALLFGMVSIAEGIDASEDTFLPQIIGQLLFVLPTTPLVAATAIRLIGELAGWFKKHPTCLEPAIRYLLSTTVSPLLRFSALTSLKQLTEKCGKHLHQVLEPMLATYESLSDSFSARERGAMIESLTHIIATIPHQPALQALQRIVPPVIQKITAILAIQPDDHPLMPVLKAVWPVLDFCFKNCSGDSGIIKANCQILRHSLLSMKAYFLPLLPMLTALLTGSFERHHNPQLVSLLAVTANIFNATSHAQALEWLSGAITAISTSFFTIMSQGANQVDPDLVDAYYKDLLLQFWRFNPQVVPLNLLDTVYQSAVASLLVFKERRVLQAVHSLLQAVTSEDRNEHAAAVRDALLQKHGKTLLHTLFTGLAGPLSRSEFAPVARLLSALVNVRPTWYREWATELFAVPSFPSAVISPDKKKKFITDAMSIKNRERFERVVSEFALQCRGLTEVGGTF